MSGRFEMERSDAPPRLEEGVYVNCSLDLSDTAVLGLDLDHTLAVYDDAGVNTLAYEETCRKLVELSQYPTSVADLEYADSAMIRGLLADTVSGNLLKLDHRDRVRRALAGQRYLKTDDISVSYGDGPYPYPDRYQVCSPFDLPAAALFASVQQFLPRGETSTTGILGDIVRTLDHVHRFGELKRRIVSQLDRFVEKRPGVGEMIAEFRAHGKKTFLLTNSDYDYTAEVLEHLFPSGKRKRHWTSLFDAVVVSADKPNFFRAPRRSARPRARRNAAVWSGGDAAALEEHLDVAPDRIFFIGDNPAADSAAARARGWRTALVVPELESDAQPPNLAGDRDGTSSSGWGSVFWEGGSPTRFARMIRESSDLFASRVETILVRGPEGVFRGV
jgi:5'-nucleotidase